MLAHAAQCYTAFLTEFEGSRATLVLAVLTSGGFARRRAGLGRLFISI